jgi:hypothetical protein
MNVRRGLFRLWLVFTALWVVAVGLFFYSPVETAIRESRYFPVTCTAARG